MTTTDSSLATTEGLLRPALTLFVALSVVTGLAYPLLTTGVAQVAFPAAANGSLVLKDGQPVGSRLIGQRSPSNGPMRSGTTQTRPMDWSI